MRALTGPLACLLVLALWPGVVSGQEPPAPASSASLVIARADALRGRGQFAEAVAVLETAMRTAGAGPERDKLRLCLAETLSSWATSLEESEGSSAAFEHYRRAYEIDKELRPHAVAADLNGIGSGYSDRGENERALECFEQALQIERETGGRRDEGETLDNIGSVYADLGERRKALGYYEQALEIEREAADRKGEARTLNNIGFLYSELGEKRRALEYYQQALPVRQDAGDRRGEAITLGNLGWVFSELGDKPGALECYEQELPIRKEVGDRKREAATLGNIASICSDLGDKRKAIQYYEQALPIRREVGDRKGEGIVLSNIGLALVGLRQHQQAFDCYEQAVQVEREAGDRNGEAITLDNVGRAYAELGDQHKALEYYERALPIRRESGDRKGEATTLGNIGRAYENLGDKQKAVEYQEQALPIRREVGDRKGEATTLNNIGRAYQDLGDKRRALAYYEQALPIQRETGDSKNEATTLNNLGSVYSDLDDNRKAVGFYERALAVEQVAGDREGLKLTFNKIATVYEALGDWRKALEYFKQDLLLDREFGDRQGEARTLNNLGVLYADLGGKPKALEYYQQALEILRTAHDPGLEATTLGNIGRVYDELGERQKALEYLERSLPLKRAAGDRGGEAITLSNVGLVYAALGDNPRALEYFEQALAILRATGDKRHEAITLGNIGAVYVALGDNRKALEVFEQVLPIRGGLEDRAGEAVTLSNIGVVLDNLGEKRNALEYYERALPILRAVGDRRVEAITLNNIGTNYADLMETQKALEYFAQALPIQRAIGDVQGQAVTTVNLMRAWKRLSAPRIAVFYGKEAVNLYQQLRANIQGLPKETQQTYTKTVAVTYRFLADVLIAEGRLPEAQQVLGLLKQEEYFDFVRREEKESPSLGARVTLTPDEADWQKRYAVVADQVARLGRKRGKLANKKDRTAEEDAELVRLDADLEAAGRAFQAFLDRLAREAGSTGPGQQRVFEVREAQGLMEDLRELGGDTVALYTLVGENSIRIILVTPDVEKAAEYRISSADVARKVFDFREVLQDPHRDPRPLAQELYRIVIGPVANDLSQAGARTLMWSLDGVLRYIPVAALHDGGQYLVERYRNVIFTPASNARLKDQPSATWRGVGLGVSHAHEGFLPLPGVPAELRGIFGDSQGAAGVLPGTVLLDDAFTVTAMKAAIRGREPVVHVASHFRFSPGNETDSFLLLGDGSHLTLDQVRSSINLFAGVDLLTLSACETAMGGEANGKEVEGFAVLAQRQGAKAVVASLWPVEDASTSLLMRELYRVREATPGTSKVEALRQAQLALLQGRVHLTEQEKAGRNMEAVSPKEGGAKTEPSSSRFVADQQAPFAHPYFWAPFILIGNFK